MVFISELDSNGKITKKVIRGNVKCEICGRLCATLGGLRTHQSKCKKLKLGNKTITLT